MRKYIKSDLLARCNSSIQAQILEVNTLFSQQKEDFLITAPLPGKWSAKQCLEHLNATLELYLPRIDSVISQSMNDSVNELKHGFIGSRLLNSMIPQEGKPLIKSRTFKVLEPGVSGNPALQVVVGFAVNMKRLKVCLEKSSHINIQRAKVTSAAGPILKLRLGDVYPFLINHNQRHILQAERAIQLCLKHK